MSEYERLLEEVKAKVDFYRRKTAREYIPSMFRALQDENPNLTPESATDRFEKDCRYIGKKGQCWNLCYHPINKGYLQKWERLCCYGILIFSPCMPIKLSI